MDVYCWADVVLGIIVTIVLVALIKGNAIFLAADGRTFMIHNKGIFSYDL
jgi:hypothetical protein